MRQLSPSDQLSKHALKLASRALDGNGQNAAVATLRELAGINREAVVEAKAKCIASDEDIRVRLSAYWLLYRTISNGSEQFGVPMTITERVKAAFRDEDTKSFGSEYLQMLLSNMKDNTEALSRSISFMLLIALMFELITRAAISDVQVGPFQLQDLSLLQRSLPVIFAYLIYNVLVHQLRTEYTWTAAQSLMRELHPSLRFTGLDSLLFPKRTSLRGFWFFPSGTWLDSVSTFFKKVLHYGSLLVALLFECYAFYELFRRFGLHDWIVWASLTFAIAFLAYGTLAYLTKRQMRKGKLLDSLAPFANS